MCALPDKQNLDSRRLHTFKFIEMELTPAGDVFQAQGEVVCYLPDRSVGRTVGWWHGTQAIMCRYSRYVCAAHQRYFRTSTLG